MKTTKEWIDQFDGMTTGIICEGPSDWLMKQFIQMVQADALDHAAEVVACSHQSVEAEEAIKSLAKSLRG